MEQRAIPCLPRGTTEPNSTGSVGFPILPTGFYPGWNPARNGSFETLRRLPFLDKQTLRSRARDLLTRRPPRGTVIFRSSVDWYADRNLLYA